MKISIWAGILLLSLAVFPSPGLAKTGLWDFSFIYSDDKTINFGWDPTPGPCPSGEQCGDELGQLRHLAQDFVDKYVIRDLATASSTAGFKKSGHYKLFIRAWSSADMQTFTYSDWNDSTQSGVIHLGGTEPISKFWLLN